MLIYAASHRLHSFIHSFIHSFSIQPINLSIHLLSIYLSIGINLPVNLSLYLRAFAPTPGISRRPSHETRDGRQKMPAADAEFARCRQANS